MTYLYAACGGIIAIFIFLILKKKKKSAADFLLIGVNLLVSAFLLADVLVNWKLTSVTVIFQNGIPLLLFPTFVFYVLQFTHSHRSRSKNWFMVFAPAVLFIVLSIFDHYILQNYPNQDAIVLHFNRPSIWYQIIFKGSQILFMVLLYFLIGQLNDFEKNLKNGYSTVDNIDVKWLKHFTWIYFSSIMLTFFLFLSQNLGFLPFEIKQVFGIVYGILILSVFYVNYQGIQHYTLLQFDPSLHKTSENEGASKEITSKKVRLTDEEEELEELILGTIEDQKLYLEPKLSLHELAEILGKSKHLISKVINSKEGRSFYDLINGYRVQHLKKLLNDPSKSNFTILTLGYESGFNSKASLNRIFKNLTGLTPKQYHSKASQSIA